MYEKAEEIVQCLKKSKDYSLWDLLSLSCVTLLNASETDEGLKKPVAEIIGRLVDGNIQLKHTFDISQDGITKHNPA